MHERPPPVYEEPPPRGVPPPPPPAQQPMGYDEAVQRSMAYAQSQGYGAELRDAHLTGNNVWKVKLFVWRGPEHGHLDLDMDAYSRQVLKVNEKVKEHGHGPHEKHDRDEDD